jgi:hypothetical protein
MKEGSMAEGRDASFESSTLRDRIEKLGLDRFDVATLAGVDPKTVENWLKKARGNKRKLRKLIAGLNGRAEKAGKSHLKLPDDFLRDPDQPGDATDAAAPTEMSLELGLALDHLQDARRTQSGEKRASFLEYAVQRADESFSKSGAEFALIIGSQALRMLARQANARGQRARLYREAISRLSHSQAVDVISERCQATIATAEDSLCGVEPAELAKLILEADDTARKALIGRPASLSPQDKADLLIRRSALLRASIRVKEPSPAVRAKFLEEASRAVALALGLHPSPYANLELAMVLWAQAQFLPEGDQYARWLRTVGSRLAAINEASDCEPALLAAMNFHRLHSAPLLVCRLYERLQRITDDITRVFENVATYAEASLNLSYDGYGEAEVRRHLESAAATTLSAIESGYRTARNLVNYIRLLVHRGGPRDAEGMLLTSFPDTIQNGVVDVAAAVRKAVELERADPLAEAFAVGINDAGVLCAMGTTLLSMPAYATAAKDLYDLALRADDNSPVAHTNLARWYLTHKPDPWEPSCRYHLKRAGSTAPRQFRWWRSIKHELEDAVTPPDVAMAPQASQPVTAERLRHCLEVGRLHDLLISHARLTSRDCHVLSEAVRRLVVLRYCTEVTRWRPPPEFSQVNAFRMEVYGQHQVIVVAADVRDLPSARVQDFVRAARRGRSVLLCFDISTSDRPNGRFDDLRPASGVDADRAITLNEHDLISLLREKSTIDRCIVTKISRTGAAAG